MPLQVRLGDFFVASEVISSLLVQRLYMWTITLYSIVFNYVSSWNCSNGLFFRVYQIL